MVLFNEGLSFQMGQRPIEIDILLDRDGRRAKDKNFNNQNQWESDEDHDERETERLGFEF